MEQRSLAPAALGKKLAGMRRQPGKAVSDLYNISYDERTPEKLQTPYSDVGQVRNVLCVRVTSTHLVSGLKKRR